MKNIHVIIYCISHKHFVLLRISHWLYVILLLSSYVNLYIYNFLFWPSQLEIIHYCVTFELLYSVPVTFMTFLLPKWNEIRLIKKNNLHDHFFKLVDFGRAKCTRAACTCLLRLINSNTRRFAPPPLPAYANFTGISLSTVNTVHNCLPARLMIHQENPQKFAFGKNICEPTK